MHTTSQSRSLLVGIGAVFAFTLLAPPAVAAEETVALLAAVAAPSVDETHAKEVWADRAPAAERVLQSGAIIGSLQEESLLNIVAPGPPPVATVDFGSAAGSRPATGEEVAEQTGVLAAQQEALSGDLGRMAGDETRSADYLPAALASGTRSESAHLATLVLPD